MIGSWFAGVRRGNTEFVCFALRVAQMHKQFIPEGVVHNQSADSKSLHLVVSCLEEHLTAVDGPLAICHIADRTSLTTILVTEQILARQQLPAVATHGFRFGIAEGTLGGGVPGHDHAVPIHCVGGFARFQQ